jgi:hypothetical protein
MLSMTRIKTLPAAIVTALLVSLITAGAVAMNMALAPYPVFQKGMTYVTWSPEAFAGKKSDESVKSMADAGINYVAVVPTWYQQEYNSVEIEPNDRTPSDASVRHVIRKIRGLGMSVMLKPHIDLISSSDGSSSRGDIGFSNEEKWNQWCDSYVKFLTHYARMADEEGAESLCVGTELSFASTRTDMWRNTIIPAIKKIYKGRLTYAANWDEYDKVEFWPELDYAGIDAYFPLTQKSSPTAEEIRAGWAEWTGKIESWQRKIGKPVLFTECGYACSDSAAKKPWEESRSGGANTRIQADCYEALFKEFWSKPWFYGMYWWNWNTYPGSGGESNRGFTPQNKPALERLKEWYSKIVNEKMLISSGSSAGIGLELDQRVSVETALKQAQPRGIAFTAEMAGRRSYDDGREDR